MGPAADSLDWSLSPPLTMHSLRGRVDSRGSVLPKGVEMNSWEVENVLFESTDRHVVHTGTACYKC